MEYFNYIAIGFLCVAVLVVLIFALFTKKFFKTMLSSALIGESVLLILHFSSAFTAFSLELTPFTLGTAGIFGLPGVVAITISKIVFKL